MLVFAVFGAALLASFFSGQFFGKNISGWAWVVGFLAALVHLWRARKAVVFPWWLWIPWIVFVAGRCFEGHEHVFQNALQILCPIVVGMAASTGGVINERKPFLPLLRRGAVIFLLLLLTIQLPMLLTGVLPDVTGLAPQAISSLLFQAVFLCLFLTSKRRIDMVLYLCFAAVPVVAVTRGPIAASVALAAFVLAPVAFPKRVLIAGIAIVTALAVFQTERIQRKMFYSGYGTVADLRSSNPDLRKSGRDTFSNMLWDEIPKRSYWGYGGNATWTALRKHESSLEQVHNDWLRLIYNYGYLGTALYAATLIAQILHGLVMARRVSPSLQPLFYGAVSAFVPYAVVMSTDNVLVYVQYFGNIQFLLLGYAYNVAWSEQQTIRKRRDSGLVVDEPKSKGYVSERARLHCS